MATIYQYEVRRENGEEDTMHMDAECMKVCTDFLTVLRKKRVASKVCDRCECAHLDRKKEP